MFFNDTVVMNSFYELNIKPTKEQEKLREDKIKVAIEYLGDKYLLAKPVERKNGRP